MSQYVNHVKDIISKFALCNIEQVPREQNAQAYSLASLGSSFRSSGLSTILIVHIRTPAIQKVQVSVLHVHNLDSVSWTTPYYEWLRDGKLPTGKIEARAFRMKPSRFVLINDVLFNKSMTGPYLRCLEPEQIKIALHKIHKGECGNHSGGCSLATNTLRT